MTIRLDETDGLMPAMNVDATIVMDSAQDVLSIPLAALNRGDRVLITKDSPSAVNALEDEAPEGYVYIKVETGVSNDDYIEVLNGLTEEDTVAYIPSSNTGTDMMQMPGGMMDMGGGPSGGPGGGPGGPGGGF